MTDPPVAEMQNSLPGSESDPKKDLERRKLQLEIRELERPFFQKPAYLTAVLPALIGLATVLVLWNRGYFEVREERQKLEAQRLEMTRAQLTTDVARLTTEHEQLQKQLAESQLTASLERLVRVIEPDNVVTVQRRVNRALGQGPSESGLVEPTLATIRELLSVKDKYADDRLAIVRRYLASPTASPEIKDALGALLRNPH